MKILVCIKAVPGTEDVSMDDEFCLMRDRSVLQWNLADESALECALSLKGCECEVTVLSMGPAKLEPMLQELFSRGVDRAVLLSDRALAGSDTLATSYALQQAAENLGPFDLIFCGRKALDGETGQVGPMLASALHYPCITNAESVCQKGDVLEVRRRLEEGCVELAMKMPGIVSFCEYSCTLRRPSLFAMRKAKEKKVELLSASELGLSAEKCGLAGSGTQVIAARNSFPGLRNGPKEQDAAIGARKLLEIWKEAKR